MGLVAVHATKPEAQNHCERDVEFIHCNLFVYFSALKTGRVKAYVKMTNPMLRATFSYRNQRSFTDYTVCTRHQVQMRISISNPGLRK